MQKRTIKVAILAVLALILVLSFSATAFADSTWSDLPDTVTAKYAITDNQVASISDGFPGGLWKPYQAVSRAQFTKMAVAAFNVDLANPAVASYTDVAKGSQYFQYIEGAKAAGLINGTTATTFSPNVAITRQQAIAIVSRFIADVQGYDLATMYTAADLDHILAHFGDAASISASLKAEVAFAFDMGITEGNALGNLAPLANLTRIQGAAFLIRAEAKVPPAQWTAKNIVLSSADKADNLIGKPDEVTFTVTDANGHPAAGVLVDFDVLYSGSLYVGNIEPQAAVTDSMGVAKCTLISHEPGTEKVSATVKTVDGTLQTKVVTAYWVALDEVYITDLTRTSENNAGEAHTWGARVVVVGPGKFSSGPYDWYNAFRTAADPTDVNVVDGIDVGDNWTYATELGLPVGYVPRTMAGINVEWTIIDQTIAPAAVVTTIPSVGKITAVTVPGTIAANGLSAVGVTNAAGLSTITVYSEATGQEMVKAVATYDGNPYPKQLINHAAINPDGGHTINWDDQPATAATAIKTWIPHVIGGDSTAPITPAYAVNNTGEVEQFTLTLKDTFGNVIPGYTVEWWLQGVGEFKTDDSSWSGIGEQNKDWDVTNAAGQADVWVKSFIPGQTIIHVKVMDKFGLPYKEWNVVKQWYSIDNVQLGYTTALGAFVSSATNPVNAGHTWTAMVTGAKYVHVLYDVNRNALMDDQALIGDRAELKAAGGFVAAMQANTLVWLAKTPGVDLLPGQVWTPTYNAETGATGAFYTRFADMTLTGAEFWKVDLQGIDTVWTGLAGKSVYFFTNVGNGGAPTSNTPLPTVISTDAIPQYVGSITSPVQAVTDANGKATVSINSTNKGVQYTYVVADYTDNQQDGNPLLPLAWHQLRYAAATKTWTPLTTAPDTIKVFEAVAGVATQQGIRLVDPVSATAANNVAQIAVQVFDVYGNALEGYKVTYEILGQGTTDVASEATYHPYAHFANPAQTLAPITAGVGDRNPNVNANPLFDGDSVNFDGDYAWGATLDHQINFTLSTASASHVDLVLDETLGQLQAGGMDASPAAAHFTDIVNIKVYTPAGALYRQFEVTKVWDITAPGAAVALTLGLSNAATGPFAASLTTNTTPLYYQIALTDQTGGIGTATNLKIRVAGPLPASVIVAAAPANGISTASFAAPTTAGTYTLTAWVDTDNDGLIDANETVVSAPATLIIN